MNRQRGSLLFMALGAVALLAIAATLIWKAQHWCNTACENAKAETVKQTARVAALEGSIKAAQDRATAIALLWSGNVTREDSNAKQRDADRAARFAPIAAAARGLPASSARVVFPADAARVLDDAIRAGNAPTAGSAREPAEGAGAAPAAAAGVVDVAGITTWGVDVAGLYSSCVDQVVGWQKFYAGLQQAQVAEQIH